MPMIPEGSLFAELLAAHPAPAARIAQLATEMQAGHMERYGQQGEGTDRYQQVIRGLVATSTVR